MRRAAKGKESRSDLSWWRPLFDPAAVRALVERVERAASGEYEKRMFRAVLRRAYEDVLELDVLNRQVRGVLSGDAGAIDMFRRTMREAQQRGVGAKRTFAPGEGKAEHDRLHRQFAGGLPCARHPLMQPSALPGIAAAMYRAAGRDVETRGEFADTLRGLWRRGRYLDFLNRASTGGESNQDLTDALRLAGRGGGRGGFDDAPGDPGMHPDENGWPPAGSGAPIDAPDGGFQPPGLGDCEFLVDLCVDQVLDGVGEAMTESRFSSERIERIAPNHACEGDIVVLEGERFGASKPPGTEVVFTPDGVSGPRVDEMLVAVCESWQDERIEVRVPAGAGKGCVGILRPPGALTPSGRSGIDAGLACLGGSGTQAPDLAATVDTVACQGAPIFLGILPNITNLSVNGRRVSGIVLIHEPRFDIGWEVNNTTEVRVRRISVRGPAANISRSYTTDYANGQVSLETGEISKPTYAEYRVTAVNACGERQIEFDVLIQTAPRLRVVGIEVTQAIQAFALDADAPRNTAPLVAGKRTVARVYVASGLSARLGVNSFQEDVRGRLEIERQDGWVVDGMQIPSADTAIKAPTLSRIDGGKTEHALNFEFPLDQVMSGSFELRARVWVGGHEEDPEGSPWAAKGEQRISFHDLNPVTVQPILITDPFPVTRAVPRLGPSTFNRALADTLARMPVAETGFTVRLPMLTHTTRMDLTVRDGWDNLLDEIDDLVGDGAYTGRAFVIGMVRALPNPALWGLSMSLRYRWEQTLWPFRWGWQTYEGHTRLLATAGQSGTVAHELGHLLGIDHTAGSVAGPYDARLPNDLIIDEGFDVAAGVAVAGTRTDVMDGDFDGWPSVVYWTVTFDALRGTP